MPEKTRTKRIAVIGGGAAGIITALKFSKVSQFEIVVFEQKANAGGVWNYNPDNTIPGYDVKKSHVENEPYFTINADSVHIPTALYSHLCTNLPAKLMSFREMVFESTAAFPDHTAVLKYLNDCIDAGDLRKYFKFNRQVLKIESKNDQTWLVASKNTTNNVETVEEFEHVVVANGHYSYPRISSIKGLKEFPGQVTHSQTYRVPEVYESKRVLVVGGSYSALDIVKEISHYAEKVYVSVRNPEQQKLLEGKTNLDVVQIISILDKVDSNSTIHFDGGSAQIDCIIFATGYYYQFPFFKNTSLEGICDGDQVNGLYLHCILRQAPSLAFVGIPKNNVPFHTAEYQAEFLSAVWNNQIELPTKEEMERVESEGGIGGAAGEIGPERHTFGSEREFVYCDALAEMYGGTKVPQYRKELRKNFLKLRAEYFGY